MTVHKGDYTRPEWTGDIASPEDILWQISDPLTRRILGTLLAKLSEHDLLTDQDLLDISHGEWWLKIIPDEKSAK